MNKVNQAIKEWYSQDLKDRKNWYSSVAAAYNQARPRYHQKLINRVIELTQLPPNATILEIGCGPGNATVAFAELGFSLVCIEPSQDMYEFAKQNCAKYPNVEFINTSLEEYSPEEKRFDAVLAANSIHWIPPEVSYPKIAKALKDDGYLILLWNMLPEPNFQTYQILQEVYTKYAPSIQKYEGSISQTETLKGFEEIVINSGFFKDIISESIQCEAIYSIDNYLLLLNTLSHYRKLGESNLETLFTALREKIAQHCGETIPIYYLSAFHLAKKILQ
ncbi:MAG TPA: class I SAM-dependent methyltransferase [Nostocaceae cyanobacterium]|nr:class I SAM-dependent methyltransferase [Nostocaceae cyanobacterium]